jgi:hypothetical protein
MLWTGQSDNRLTYMRFFGHRLLEDVMSKKRRSLTRL